MKEFFIKWAEKDAGGISVLCGASSFFWACTVAISLCAYFSHSSDAAYYESTAILAQQGWTPVEVRAILDRKGALPLRDKTPDEKSK